MIVYPKLMSVSSETCHCTLAFFNHLQQILAQIFMMHNPHSFSHYLYAYKGDFRVPANFRLDCLPHEHARTNTTLEFKLVLS